MGRGTVFYVGRGLGHLLLGHTRKLLFPRSPPTYLLPGTPAPGWASINSPIMSLLTC